MPITVPGGSTNVAVNGSDVLDLARQIRDALVFAQDELGDLGVTTVDAASQPLPNPGPEGTQELVLFATDTVNAAIPAGWGYVVVTGSSPVTLTGIQGAAILDDQGGGLFAVDGSAGIASIAAVSGANTILASGQYVISAPSGLEDLLVFADGSGTIAAGPGSTSIKAGGTNNLIWAGVGDTTVDSSGIGNSIFGSFNGTAGSLTAIISGDNTVLSIGDDHATVTASGSHGFIQGGNEGSTLQVVDLGSYNVFNALSSNESATLAGSAAYLQGGTSGTTITVVDNDTNDTINALHSNVAVTANGSGLFVNTYGSSGSLNFVGGGSTSTICGGNGDVAVTVGAGGVLFSANGTTNSVSGVAGSVSTIYGASDPSLVYFGGAGNLIYSAGLGNATLNAADATGNVNAWLPGSGNGADSIKTGSGNDTITSGAGSDTLSAGSGRNLFLFVAGHTGGATDYVTDTAANIANDTFNFNNYGTDLIKSATADGVTVTLSDGSKVIFTQLTSTSQLDGHINVYNAPH